MSEATPIEVWQERISSGELQRDAGQESVTHALDALYHVALNQNERRIWKRLLRHEPEAKLRKRGAYIWGGVGRGKSMLMDLFYDCLPMKGKRRVHFHAFMRDVHSRIHSWRQLKPKGDLLKLVARDIGSRLDVLCLDEIQVHDIADASILSGLFQELAALEVIIVFTSNRPPEDLYQGGVGRESFLPFIDLLHAQTEIIEIQSNTDYRLEQLSAFESTYLSPLNDDTTQTLNEIYCALTQNKASKPITLEVSGRHLLIERSVNDVAWMTFADLCERSLGASDYLEIASEFHTLILQDIPILSPEKRNEAKRFVTLIDALYEHKVKFICTAAAPPEALYPEGHGAFEFERTASRLIEMQSERYLGMAHVTE